MKQDSQQRRRPRGGGGSRRPRRGDYEPVPKAPEKQTFLQKIVSFFKGSATTLNTGQVRSEQTRRSSQPQSSRPDRFERTSRKPEFVEVNSPKLYVGNLSFDATESDLFELFNGVGKVQNAEVVSNKYTQKSKGFAFVTLQTVDEARRAVKELHDKDFMGRKLVVSGAKTNDPVSDREANGNGDDGGSANAHEG